MPPQGNLPRNSMARFENKFSWSFTRDRLYKRCPRAYYYQYYGSWNGWEATAPAETRKIYFLKNLTGIHPWKGQVVEWVIQDLIDLIVRREMRRLPSTADLHRQAALKLKREWRSSLDNLSHLKGKAFRLAEHYYSEVHGEPSPEPTAIRIQEEVRACLTHFRDGGFLEMFRKLRTTDWVHQQKNGEFSAKTFELGGVPVWASPDLAVRDATGVVVYDWKAGRYRSDNEPLQLACYALYIQDQHRVLATAIRTMVVALRDAGPWVAEEVIQDNIDQTRGFVEASVATLRSALADPDQNVAVIDDFPMNASDRTCPTCNFREICRGWQEVKGALAVEYDPDVDEWSPEE